ncbi:MAG: hypothetical protein ACI828_002328 [Flavobacteriales bacterium]|jgi:hypothetical protein
MSAYKTDDSRKQIKVTIWVISPGDAASLVFLEGTQLIESPDNFGGNIPASKVGVNRSLDGKTMELATAIDLTTILPENRKKALEMINVTYAIEGGPEGKKLLSSDASNWFIIGDNETIFIKKPINFI